MSGFGRHSKFILQTVSTIGLCVTLANPAFSEDLDGQLVFNNNCRMCHSMDEGDNRLGPTLHNVLGRKAGSIKGYDFSPSMKNANITWTSKILDQFIADPDAIVPGNQMQPYGGMKDEAERAVLVEFLAQKN